MPAQRLRTELCRPTSKSSHQANTDGCPAPLTRTSFVTVGDAPLVRIKTAILSKPCSSASAASASRQGNSVSATAVITRNSGASAELCFMVPVKGAQFRRRPALPDPTCS